MVKRFNRWSATIPVAALAGCLVMQWSGTTTYAAEAQRKRVIRPPAVVEEERTDESAAAFPESVRAERALVKKPRDRQARLQAARARLAEGADNASNVEAARNHATQVLADNPNDLEALLLAGQTSILKNDLAAAANYYRQATLANANSAPAFLGLGDVLTRLGDEPGATAAFARYRSLMGMPPLVTQAPAK